MPSPGPDLREHLVWLFTLNAEPPPRARIRRSAFTDPSLAVFANPEYRTS